LKRCRRRTQSCRHHHDKKISGTRTD
jgi:hypothetical protein